METKKAYPPTGAGRVRVFFWNRVCRMRSCPTKSVGLRRTRSYALRRSSKTSVAAESHGCCLKFRPLRSSATHFLERHPLSVCNIVQPRGKEERRRRRKRTRCARARQQATRGDGRRGREARECTARARRQAAPERKRGARVKRRVEMHNPEVPKTPVAGTQRRAYSWPARCARK